MNITLNNTTSNIITFTDVENIITFQEPVSGQPSKVLLAFSGNLAATVTADSQYYITLFDETITNVVGYQNATNRRFWISTSPTNTATSVAEALRNCPTIAAEWDIQQEGYLIYLTAKRIGDKLGSYSYWNLQNIPAQYLTIAETQHGSSTSALLGGKANIDVTRSGETVGRMSKEIYGQYTDFNISPLLASYASENQVTEFTLSPSTITSNGEMSEYNDMTVYMAPGYECNGSQPFLTFTTARILANKQHNGANNVNYIYSPTLEYSVMHVATASQTIYYRLYDSTHAQIYNGSRPMTEYKGKPWITDISYTFPNSAFTNAYYVEVQIGSDKIEWQVIKPLNATEYYQRVYWRNEYGGISFFDFTGEKQESFNVNQLTYNKNTFDRYRDSSSVSEKIYSNTSDKVYTLTTHLMEKDGKYALDSLALAKNVWTTLGNQTYHIIPTAISVQENAQYNNIFTAQLSYRIV